MTKNLLSFLMLLPLTVFSQINFEPGHYIDNNGTEIKGLIKNLDWKNNPTSFEFKPDESSEIKIISIDAAQAFTITDVSHYVRRDIDVEKSSLKINSIGNKKEPEYVNERLFLKEIVSGTHKLFKYEETGIEKFFYAVNDSEIKQLIFIKYKASYEDMKNNENIGYTTILTNDYFKRQLWNDVKCETTSQRDIKVLNFIESDLIKYFTSINLCKGDKPNELKKASKSSFNLKIAATYNISSLKVADFSPSYSPDFSDSSFGFGFEAEIVLPFNNNKWGVFLEPSYNSFKGEKTNLPPFGISTKPEVATSNIKYVQVPLGIRHYFFLNNKSKIFLNAIGNVRIINKNYSVEYESNRYPLHFANTTFSIAGGLGFAYDKLSAEVRYFLPSNITNRPAIPIDFNNLSFTLRYQVFNSK